MSADATCGCLAPDGGQIRYGVFLRPPARLVADALRGYAVTGGLFGYRSANAYPPHVTLVGSIAPSVPEGVLVDAVDAALARRAAVRLATEGLTLSGGTVYYQFADAPGAAASGGVADLMGALLAAVAGLRHYHDDDFTAARRRRDSPERFKPHLSLISFDGAGSPELSAEALELLGELGLAGPAEELFEWVHLVRLHARDWSGPYWETLTWSVVRAWRLGAADA